MQLKNYAAWIPKEKAQLEVKEAPLHECGPDELLLQTHHVAINPVDWKIQQGGGFNLKYPAILGEDVAGEVLEVGKNLKHKYNIGSRVIAHSLGLGLGPAYGGFQLHPVVKGVGVSLVPDHVSFAEAVVLPLSVSTAAAGLYLKSTLGLDLPEVKAKDVEGRKKSKTLLLWGGSSSVGSSVIQLASASGYDVVTTASPANYSYCKKLGATLVLDYHNPDVVQLLIAVMRDTEVVGAYDAIGAEATVKQCASVLLAFGGGKVASVVAAPDVGKGVEVARIGSTNIFNQEPKVGKKIWQEYLPAALEEGELVGK